MLRGLKPIAQRLGRVLDRAQELIDLGERYLIIDPNSGARPGEHAHGHLELGISKEAMPKLKKSKQVGKVAAAGLTRAIKGLSQ